MSACLAAGLGGGGGGGGVAAEALLQLEVRHLEVAPLLLPPPGLLGGLAPLPVPLKPVTTTMSSQCLCMVLRSGK